MIHQGTLDFGHYYCYIKRGQQWFMCNDETIGENYTEEHVLNHAAGDGSSSSNAYVLFYSHNDFYDSAEANSRIANYKHYQP